MEEFEYQGYWWLPDEPEDKVPGTLKFDPIEGTTLNLLGVLEGLEGLQTAPQPALILGMSSDGRSITLQDCSRIGATISFPGYPISTWTANRVLVGAHFDAEDDVGFERLIVHYFHLNEWAGVSGFDHVSFAQPPEAAPIRIEHNLPDPITVSVGRDMDITLDFEAKLNLAPRPVVEAGVVQNAYFTIKFPRRKPLDELLETVYYLQNFLSLGVGVPVYPQAVLGALGPPEEAVLVEIYYRPLGRTDSARRVLPAEMLFAREDLPGGLDRSLNDWFEKAENLEPVYQLYFGLMYDPRTYPRYQFLGLMQALEAYHRRTTDTRDLPEEEHERRIDSILEAAPEEYRDWLEKKLAYSNEPNLRKRLKEIFGMYPESVAFIVGDRSKDRQRFIDKIGNTRNYLTHHDESLKRKAARGEELIQIIRKLRSLLKVCLLGKIGFEDTQIKDRLFRSAH
jgi:hypothetical protein